MILSLIIINVSRYNFNKVLFLAFYVVVSYVFIIFVSYI